MSSNLVRVDGKRYYLETILSDSIPEDYFLWITDPEVNKYLEVRFHLPKTKDDLKGYVDSCDGVNRFLWGIYHTDSQSYIGNMALYINRDNMTADYGYFVGDKTHWGTSAGVEATSIMLDYAFSELKLRKVWGGVIKHNIGSLFNYMKLGFTKEGCLRKHYLSEEGPSDGIIFGMLKEEWLSQREKLDYR